MTVRLFEQVSDQIRRDLAAGNLKPGDKLPSERDLAEKLKVGRPVVREGLRSLEEAGLLEFRRGVTGGAFIRSGDSGAMTRSMTDLLFLGVVSVENIFEARMVVLRFTAERAAERATDEDLDLLERTIEETRRDYHKVSSAEDRSLLVGRFYEVLAKAAHNDVLIVLIRSLSELIVQLMVRTYPQLFDTVNESRQRLMKHLRTRDSKAAGEEVARHLEQLHAAVISMAGDLQEVNLQTFFPNQADPPRLPRK